MRSKRPRKMEKIFIVYTSKVNGGAINWRHGYSKDPEEHCPAGNEEGERFQKAGKKRKRARESLIRAIAMATG